ncbi:DUF5642 family protein [Mycobacterium sp. Marseille-P9652]|uniref:DUF5642 family protein n=1 Tax=Mycobacterium sp. Marseille-P9652 TaxID=2654950 RepID=UPI0012E88AB7|nr:DUF5642 family protein [Mycobacterium sp. Marseille-P9652]
MRPFGAGFAACLALAACTHAPAPARPSPASKSPRAQHVAVNPARIKRVVGDMPPGYEVTTGVPDAASPTVIWSLPGAAATPPQCAALADPGDGRGHSAQGVSASGAGGIVHAVVVAVPAPAQLDRDLLPACGQWSMAAGRTTADVRLVDAPHVDDADTVGMVAEIRSSVESGTEIGSRTWTFVAYLGDYYAFTTLTTDPGSALPALPASYAADLLVKTVSTLRG